MTPPATTSHPRRRSSRNRVLFTVAAVVVGLLWALARAHTFGSVTALLGTGPENQSYSVVHREIPDVYVFRGGGFDGMQYYALARRPFDIKATSRYLEPPAYRYHRILYPVLGGLLAPHGGTALIIALLAVSLAGVALGAWWLGAFPGAPPWLPLAMVLSPGVICSLFLTLADALATGLVIAAFGAMFKRRLGLVILFLTLAVLTRETSIIAAFALALWAGLSWRDRVLLVVAPAIPLAAWSLYTAHVIGQSVLVQPRGGSFTWPFVGWTHSGSPVADLVVAILMGVLLAGALLKWRTVPLPITAYVGASLLQLVCVASVIAQGWFGTTRVVAAAVPLAIWVITKRSPVARRPAAAPV